MFINHSTNISTPDVPTFPSPSNHQPPITHGYNCLVTYEPWELLLLCIVSLNHRCMSRKENSLKNSLLSWTTDVIIRTRLYYWSQSFSSRIFSCLERSISARHFRVHYLSLQILSPDYYLGSLLSITVSVSVQCCHLAVTLALWTTQSFFFSLRNN